MIKYLILMILTLALFGCLGNLKTGEKFKSLVVYEVEYKNKTIVCVGSYYENNVIMPDCNWDEYNKVDP